MNPQGGRPTKENQETKDTFIEYLKKYRCNPNKACKVVGISLRTVYNWRHKDPKFDMAIKDAQEELNYAVENNLVDAALDDKKQNTVAQIFYLKNNMRNKYGEQIQHNIEVPPLWFQQKEPPKKIDVEEVKKDE